uniref:Uncharacterized protein n=1 Tax=Strigamia maritima TaxID=126957 RepID=T1JEY5_STRMM
MPPTLHQPINRLLSSPKGVESPLRSDTRTPTPVTAACRSSERKRESAAMRPGVQTTLPILCLLVVTCVAALDPSRCEEITIPMCRGIGYNATFMPNQFNHDTQDEAGLEVHQFWPLVEIQCSPDLKFFLCSMYAPICIEDYLQPLPACRSVCDRAKAGCAPLMRLYGFAWPERMNCDRLPEYGDPSQLCMDSKNGSSPETTTRTPAITPNKERSGKHGMRGNKGTTKSTSAPTTKIKSLPPCQDCDCHSPLVWVNESSPLYNRVSTGRILNCAVPCRGWFFIQERSFTAFWIGVWSVLCFISTAVTVATFLIDVRRFRYPERPIIFLSACYLFVSLGYIIRFLTDPSRLSCHEGLMRYEAATSDGACNAVFLLVYFFGMASSIWWVVLAFTWFLAAGLKWGNEAIASYSHYFHLAAWFIPSVQSAVVLATNAVDGDPVSGICSVGNANVVNQRGFLLAPLVACLVVGTTFLGAGFVALFRIRSVIKQQPGHEAKADKLEKLMIRIGVFSVLYTVPATLVVACLFYEQHFRDHWERQWVCPKCHKTLPASSHNNPDYSAFMLKYFMSLVVGITSGFWIWSGKTVDSWRRFYRRVGRSSGARPQQGLMVVPPQLPSPVVPGTPGVIVASPCGRSSAILSIHNPGGIPNKLMPLSHNQFMDKNIVLAIVTVDILVVNLIKPLSILIRLCYTRQDSLRFLVRDRKRDLERRNFQKNLVFLHLVNEMSYRCLRF